MQSAKGFYDREENAQCFGNMNMHFGSTRYCFMGHRLKYGRAESFPEARLAKTAYFCKEMGIVLIMRGSSLKYCRIESFPEARFAKTAYFFNEMGIELIMRGISS
ncbi:hypothetical protein CDAR_373541 [Caerostris darwini]|uniref:Uncharacterized protein n=1 Tax=Caerostris darwini TaxID=1538125 RepID=A0AAV4QLF8_9ARAC|nr:hypothetical protein CDAR_373541 [Caerostris darwini]